jgi:outer membrane protein assembly factor BamB
VQEAGVADLGSVRRFALVAASLLVAATGCAGNGEPSATAGASPPTSAGSGRDGTNTGSAGEVEDSWFTYHRDRQRTGYDELATRASGELNKAWSRALDGAVYGEPLVVDGRVIAVTEHDSVYALTITGNVVWRRHLGTPARLSALPCGNIDPLGITSTPVYDPASGNLFVVAELSSPIRHRLYALDPTTGQVRWSRSVDPKAMHPRAQQQRGALAIARGRVWVGLGGLDGDCGPYHGWLVGVPTGGTGTWRVYRTPSSREAGIWAPSGPAVDSSGHLYVAVGNGASTSPPYDDSDSVLRLRDNHVVSLFAPAEWASENAADLDLGSTGPAIVRGIGRTWIFADGKAGNGYLLDPVHLGGIGGQAATLSGCESFGGTAFHGGTIYVPCVDGMQAVRIRPGPSLQVVWQSTATGFGSSPVLGGGALWAVNEGRLIQLEPRTGRMVTSIKIGECPHFATPTLHRSLVLVGTLTGVTAVRAS